MYRVGSRKAIRPLFLLEMDLGGGGKWLPPVALSSQANPSSFSGKNSSSGSVWGVKFDELGLWDHTSHLLLPW